MKNRVKILKKLSFFVSHVNAILCSRIGDFHFSEKENQLFLILYHKNLDK